jgi:hypothetical protein
VPSPGPEVDQDVQLGRTGALSGDTVPTRARPIRAAIAYSLIVLSFVVWFAILAVPWLPLSLGQASALVTALIITGEITFYAGVALLGRKIWDRIKGSLLRGKNERAAPVVTSGRPPTDVC